MNIKLEIEQLIDNYSNAIKAEQNSLKTHPQASFTHSNRVAILVYKTVISDLEKIVNDNNKKNNL